MHLSIKNSVGGGSRKAPIHSGPGLALGGPGVSAKSMGLFKRTFSDNKTNTVVDGAPTPEIASLITQLLRILHFIY